MKNNLLNEILFTFWSQRDLRERRMLLICGAVVGAAIVYLTLIDPAWSGREKLQKSIPQLRLQAAEMQQLSQQYSQFSAALNETISPISKETVEAALSHRGIKAESVSISDDLVRVQLKQVDYGSLMDWALEMQKGNRLTVEEAKITSLKDPAQVDAILTLKQQRRS